jgi:hypothetical protein
MERLIQFLSNPAVIAALIAAAVTLFGLWLNPFAARRLEREKAELQKSLERAKAELRDASAARDARRDYEYEARKRLYEQIEPLLFQLYEAVERAHSSARGLARDSRAGRLEPGPGNWLTDEYYLNSIVYRLLTPVAFLRIVQRRMTFVDFDVDATIRAKYQLLKMYARSFTHDLDLAQLEPALHYEPYHPKAAERLEAEPAVYAGQALVAGDLDNAADALLTEDGDRLRPMTFGEFQIATQAKRKAKAGLDEVFELYRGFAPANSPVLVRMLLMQGCITRLLMDSYAARPVTELTELREAFLRSDDFLKRFSWSAQSDLGADEAAMVRAYIDKQLQRLPVTVGTDGRSLRWRAVQTRVAAGYRQAQAHAKQLIRRLDPPDPRP